MKEYYTTILEKYLEVFEVAEQKETLKEFLEVLSANKMDAGLCHFIASSQILQEDTVNVMGNIAMTIVMDTGKGIIDNMPFSTSDREECMRRFVSRITWLKQRI